VGILGGMQREVGREERERTRMINPNIFRANDVRGKVGSDLTDTTAEEIGKAFGSYVRQIDRKRVYIGRDNRPSSRQFEAKLIDGVLTTGCDVFDIGLVPTPVLYFASARDEGSFGVMVTGSHLPVTSNGFKFCQSGQTLYQQELDRVRDIVVAREFVTGTGTLSASPLTIREYMSQFQELPASKAGMQVVVDCQNGAASELAPMLFESLGIGVNQLHCDLAASYPFERPDPQLLTNLEPLRERVLEANADLGIAYDGDADRLGVVDNQGNGVAADRIVAILARDVLSDNPGGKVVYDILSSQVLIDEIRKNDGVPIACESGHAFIKAKLREEDALLAGEYSGHIFFADRYFGYDDGIYASYRLVELLSRSDLSLAQLDQTLPRMFTSPEARPYCPDGRKYQVIEEIRNGFNSKRYRLITTESSVRIVFDNGWGLIRASNTEPALSLRFEAQTSSDLELYQEICWSMLIGTGRDCGIEFGGHR